MVAKCLVCEMGNNTEENDDNYYDTTREWNSKSNMNFNLIVCMGIVVSIIYKVCM